MEAFPDEPTCIIKKYFLRAVSYIIFIVFFFHFICVPRTYQFIQQPPPHLTKCQIAVGWRRDGEKANWENPKLPHYIPDWVCLNASILYILMDSGKI